MNGMSDEEKSMILARLAGWDIDNQGFRPPQSAWNWQRNMYDEPHTALARYILRWFDQSGLLVGEWRIAIALGFAYGYSTRDTLDTILGLAITAGLVEEMTDGRTTSP